MICFLENEEGKEFSIQVHRGRAKASRSDQILVEHCIDGRQLIATQIEPSTTRRKDKMNARVDGKLRPPTTMPQ
ncbi:hypothetical protein Q5752_005493 [Cryptotrichosporon argae]